MSDNTPTESPRLLRSPFNGEVWPVPPDLTEAQYAYMIRPDVGFVPVEDEPVPVVAKRKDAARARG